MRYLIPILLAAFTASAQVDVYVDLANFGLLSVSNRPVTIKPYSENDYTGKLIVRDEWTTKTPTNSGDFWLSNMVPAVYDIIVAGKVQSVFRINITNTSGAIGADSNRVAVGSTVTVGYTKAQIDALLAALPQSTNTASVFTLDADGDLTPSTTTSSDTYWQTVDGNLTPR